MSTPVPVSADMQVKHAWSRKPLFAVIVATVIALAGAFWFAAPGRSESTDKAHLQADSSPVAPKVRGLVADVPVQPNQRVLGTGASNRQAAR